jgi:transcriptional regulator with XRE-family HTH domain
MNAYPDLQVGFKIRKMRELKNLTRAQVAHQLGLAERSYADIENENCSITLERLFDITKIFECDICTLLEFSSQKMMQFYVNNHGEKMQNINHQEVTNEIRLIEGLLRTKDELIQSKNAIIQQLEQQIKGFKNK